MKIELKYVDEKSKLLSFAAEDIVKDMTKALQPLANEIDKEKARIILHFGKDSKVEVIASEKLHKAILKLL